MAHEALDMNDILALQALNRKFEYDSETKRLNESGWADFDGITIGGAPINAPKLLAGGYVQERPHPLYEGASLYRIATMGFEAIAPYPDDTFALD